MSWLYSRVLVEEYLAVNCLDGAPSALLSGIPTPQAYLPPDKMTDFCRLSQFGMTFAHLTADLGEALLTWFLAVSPARTFPQPEPVKDLTAHGLGCGWKWPESSVKYDQPSALWKTRQCSLFGGLVVFLETWPRWGTMRNGECWERLTWERRTNETEYGLLPTPLASNTKAHHMRGADKGKERSARSYLTWPTPTKSDGTGGPGCSGRAGGLILRTAVTKWPTPTVNDSKNSTLPPSQVKHANIPGALLRSGEKTGGQLNPEWVEWLMGGPLGWTDCKPLEMDRCQDATLRHG